MTRLRSFAAMALVIALAAVATSAPVALSQKSSRETFKLTSIDKKEKTAEVDNNGDGDADDLGERDIGGGPLFDNGKRAGTQRHDCAVTKSNGSSVAVLCQGSFTVKGRGTIELSGWLKFADQGDVSSRFSIIGGTRDFRDATGHVVFGGTRRTTTFEFHVVHG
jgi:hypothetical protein